jgi:TRAP-type C4-dicarboxylate transport system permease small subunit
MVMWVGFLGACLATRQEKHFGVDIIDRFLPARALHVSRIVVYAFAATVAFLLTNAAIDFLIEGIGPEELDLFELPKRLYFAIIPSAFGLIGIHFLLHVARHIHAIITGEPATREQAPPQTIF